jgi:mono/diheme cytochrome c family protein
MTRNSSRLCCLIMILSGLIFISGCGRKKQTAQADPLMDVFRRQAQEEGLSRQQTQGKRLFIHYCATCHGDRGEGDGQNAYNLNPAPPNFSQVLKANPPTYWRQIIEGGTAAIGRSPLCPPWSRELKGVQIDAIVSYLKVLAAPPVQPQSANPNETRTP